MHEDPTFREIRDILIKQPSIDRSQIYAVLSNVDRILKEEAANDAKRNEIVDIARSANIPEELIPHINEACSKRLH